MKRTYLVLFICSVCMALYAQEPVFSVSDNNIIIKKKFVEKFMNEKWTDITPYVPVKNIPVSAGTCKYSVQLMKYKNWENEPGDYNVIKIRNENENKTILFRTYDEGWDYFYTAKDYKKSQDVPFKEIVFGLKDKVLVFTGVTIMSQPPFITIVLIHNGKATLVYNKPSYINEIKKNGNNIIFDLQLNTVEYDDNHKPYNNAEYATMTFRNGMIFYTE